MNISKVVVYILSLFIVAEVASHKPFIIKYFKRHY